MSAFHCSCGFAINDADEFGDHLREVFDRGDDTGTDGRVHAEIDTPGALAPAGMAGGGDRGSGREPPIVCTCGFATRDAAEFDDHTLLVLLPPDSIGNDGEKHVPVDPSTPDRWYIQKPPGD